MLAKCNAGKHTEWISNFTKLKEIEHEKVITKEFNCTGELKMAEVINHLSKINNGDAVVVTDVGQHQMVTSRYYKYKNPTNEHNFRWCRHNGIRIACGYGRKMGIRISK